MSLISEALKEAQRERSERAGPRAAATIVDTVFPYPSKARTAAPNRAMLFGVAGAAVIVIAAASGVRWFLNRPAKPAVSAPSSRVPVKATPLAPSTKVAAKVAAPETRKIVPPAAAPAVSREPAHVAAPTKVAAPPHRVIASDSAPSGKPSAPAPTPVASTPPAAVAPAPVQPQGSASSGVRIVLDPAGSRPSDALFAQAFAEQKRGNLDMARDLYEKALQKPPVAPELYNNYGALLASLGNNTAAIAMYQLGLKANESDARLWSNLAASYNATGRHAEAMSAYAEAAKLDPSNGVVKTRLAAEYVAIGDSASARRLYEEAARTSPKDPMVHHAYGSFLVGQRDYKGAVRELQLFIDLGASTYDAAKIDEMRRYVASLRKVSP